MYIPRQSSPSEANNLVSVMNSGSKPGRMRTTSTGLLAESRPAVGSGSTVCKIHSHEVRDLLKSTLLVSGCAQYAADHVLGHAPRDSYEKQAVLYPRRCEASTPRRPGG